MILDLVFVAVFVYLIWSAVTRYRAAEGSVWARLKSAGWESVTVLWLRFVALVASGIDLLVQAANLVNAPQVASAITQYGDPKVVAGIMIAVAFIGEWARRRKGSNDPINP